MQPATSPASDPCHCCPPNDTAVDPKAKFGDAVFAFAGAIAVVGGSWWQEHTGHLPPVLASHHRLTHVAPAPSLFRRSPLLPAALLILTNIICITVFKIRIW